MAIGRLDNGAPSNTIEIQYGATAADGERSVASATELYKPTAATRPEPPPSHPMTVESYRMENGRPVPVWTAFNTPREPRG